MQWKGVPNLHPTFYISVDEGVTHSHLLQSRGIQVSQSFLYITVEEGSTIVQPSTVEGEWDASQYPPSLPPLYYFSGGLGLHPTRLVEGGWDTSKFPPSAHQLHSNNHPDIARDL